jgi:hypothetical protein
MTPTTNGPSGAVSETERSPLFTRRPSRKARALTPLAGLLGVVLVANALIGLFSLHYAQKGTVAHFAELGDLMADLDGARRARGDFKVQVQEWKNILLRHDDPDALARHRAAFAERERSTRETLAHLSNAQDRDPVLKDRITALLTEHQILGEQYQAALAQAEAAPEGFSPKVADGLARGLDRPLDDALDALAQDLFSRAANRRGMGSGRLRGPGRRVPRAGRARRPETVLTWIPSRRSSADWGSSSSASSSLARTCVA